MGHANLADIERQAEENLRHSFAVVGLLHELDAFYRMLSARVKYIDTSLNAGAHGAIHSSGSGPEALRCKQRFKEAAFQADLLAASPELRALKRLYRVGTEVNRFQKDELQQCEGWGTKEITTRTSI